ncbi:hypothetical protein [Burkholderia latens]|uniref:hypothetical protein n=1 Tax=Burkholderia latens TaxID=488446 RepID=UPI001AE86C71|nr:hypothetical protein [Burkholderia latens]QTO46337.1 hypothetical protein J8I85_17995 [Burkholderia latens]
MTPRKHKLTPSPEALRDFLKTRRPYTLPELMMTFAGGEEEVQFALFTAQQLGWVSYFPPGRKRCARWAYNDQSDNSVAGPRISPLSTSTDFKYDLYSHANLTKGFRRQ